MDDKTPKRIQRKRTKGWRMPEGAVSVTRPHYFGNPFRIGVFAKLGNGGDGTMYTICWEEKHAGRGYVAITSAAEAVELYREFRKRYPLSPDAIDELRGKDLACWCPLISQGCYVPCHADVLLSIANNIPIEDVIRENTRWAEREALR